MYPSKNKRTSFPLSRRRARLNKKRYGRKKASGYHARRNKRLRRKSLRVRMIGTIRGHSSPRRRAQIPKNKAGALFAPRYARSCSNPALSTYDSRGSLLPGAGRTVQRIAIAIAIALAVLLLVMGTRYVSYIASQSPTLTQTTGVVQDGGEASTTTDATKTTEAAEVTDSSSDDSDASDNSDVSDEDDASDASE